MLTLAMPQSEPSAQEPLGLAQVAGEDRRRQSLRHGVVQRDRLVEVVVGRARRGSARRSRRSTTAVCAGIRTSAGRDVAAAGADVDALAAGDHLAAVGARLVQRGLHGVEGALVDQRADQRRRRRTGRRPAAGRYAARQPVDEPRRRRTRARSAGAGVVQRWPAVPAAANTIARTARSRSADGATIDGVVAAELEQHPAEPGGDPRADLAAHPRRAGGADAGRPAGRRPAPRRPRGRPARAGRRPAGAPTLGDRPCQQRVRGQRGQRRLLRRLPHHGVAADQRERGVPRPHRDREVERARSRRRRRAGATSPCSRWPGALRRHRAPVQLARQADGEVADVDHLLHLAEGLGADLARLDA